MLGTPAVCYGIGAGPISFSVGRWMVRRVLRSCPLIIVRDRSSRELLIQCGVDPARIQVTADVAFRLPAVSTGLSELYPAVFDKPRKRPLIGIFPRRWFQYGKAVLPVRWQRRVTNHKASRAMIQLLADTADTLICEDQAAVVLVPMKRCGGRRDPGQDDDTLCYEIRRHMKFGDQVTVADKETCPEQLRAFIGQMDAVISMRMHAMIFAAGQGVPFAALSLSAKFDDLAERLETTECMIPVQQANKARLLECARQVIDWPPARRCRLQDHARQLADCSARNPELFNEWWANVKAAQRY
jgi:polysaccharide pyruvyl transferase WcaK-like protein